MPEILTVKEACEILKVSKTTFYRLIREKDIPAIKIRNSVRIKRDDLILFINNYGQKIG